VSDLRVAVVGGGIAGLSVAAHLAAAGIDATVYERHLPGPGRVEAGYGIQLSPNATRLLHRLGLLIPDAVRVAAIDVMRWDGTPVSHAVLGQAAEARYGAPYLTTTRAALHKALTRPARHGHRCTAVVERQKGVELSLVDGATVLVDLVIGADGIHSAVRKALVDDRPRDSGLTVHRGLAPAVPRPDPVVRVWLGPQAHLVCYPVTPSGPWNVVAVAPAGVPVEKAFDGWHPEARAVLDAAGALASSTLRDRAPLTRWCTGRIALTGDAAHAMLPFAAQGANQAIEDAATLAMCLRGAGVPEALTRYEQRRIPRLARVADLVRSNVDGKPDPDRDWLYGYDAEGDT
jgi:salicylate hydroxylase